MTDSLQLLKEPGYFVYGTKDAMLSTFSLMHMPEVELQVATRDWQYAGSVITGKRSPLTPMLNKGKTRRIIREGLLFIIYAMNDKNYTVRHSETPPDWHAGRDSEQVDG